MPTWLLLVLITLAAMAGCAVLGVVIERFAYRPLRNAPRIAPLISALGVSFFLAYSMQLMFGSEQRDYDAFSLSGGALFFNGFDIGNVRVPLLRIVLFASAFLLMIVLWLLVTRTRIGTAMRATSYDREAASMMGIDVDRVIVFAFVLGSALAGAAGVMFALRAPTDVAIGFLAGLKGFTAAVIGGIGSIPGAMAGGLILGFAEAFTAGLHLDALVRPARVRDPDPLHALPPTGLARQAGHQEGLSGRERKTPGRLEEAVPAASATAGPRIGAGRVGRPLGGAPRRPWSGGGASSKRACGSCPGGLGSPCSSRSSAGSAAVSFESGYVRRVAFDT